MNPQSPVVVDAPGCAKASCGSAACDGAALPLSAIFAAPEAAAPSGRGQVFRIATMDCIVEESEIRRALEPVAGIRSLGFQLGARTLRIDATDSARVQALAAIRKAGFNPQAVPEVPTVPGSASGSERRALGGHTPDEHAQGTGNAQPFGGTLRLGAALVLALGAEALSFFAPDLLAWKVAGMAIAAVAIWLAGWETYAKGMAALLRGKLNINALMSVAVTGAFLIGQWPEAAMVMALYAIAELIEARAVDRARNAIRGLLDLAPETALMQGEGADGQWTRTPAAAVPLNAMVRVRPGERVPLDGIVARGNSAIDQAPITGESIPVDKAPGDAVFAGTINQTGELDLHVTAAAGNSTLARIIEAVEQAQNTRAPTQRFVDRFALWYTPAVFALAIAVAVLAPVLLGIGWLEALYKALVLLVIACPCALVISTPVTVVSGLAAGARRGILIKGGTYLEDARLLKVMTLDKTGTLTEGKPALVDWSTWEGADAADAREMGRSLAGRSDHPVSVAIAQGIDAPAREVTDFQALPGRGVEGVIAGRRLWLGNHRLMHERGLCGPALEAALATHEQQGRSVTLLADETRVLAFFAVADTLRAGARQAVAELKALNIACVMLSGDNQATVQAIAAQAGIGDARGDLLPEHKLAAIRELQQRHGRTAMAGDGINDAPALAQADIGFAMGGAGTDIAMEAADVVVMNDDLRRLPETVRLSRRTHAVLWQNIALALGIKAVFLGLAVLGTATMWMAVFADMGASLLVIGNGLRLLRANR